MTRLTSELLEETEQFIGSVETWLAKFELARKVSDYNKAETFRKLEKAKNIIKVFLIELTACEQELTNSETALRNLKNAMGTYAESFPSDSGLRCAYEQAEKWLGRNPK